VQCVTGAFESGVNVAFSIASSLCHPSESLRDGEDEALVRCVCAKHRKGILNIIPYK
jgi:hypothetical protein